MIGAAVVADGRVGGDREADLRLVTPGERDRGVGEARDLAAIPGDADRVAALVGEAAHCVDGACERALDLVCRECAAGGEREDDRAEEGDALAHRKLLVELEGGERHVPSFGFLC